MDSEFEYVRVLVDEQNDEKESVWACERWVEKRERQRIENLKRCVKSWEWLNWVG